jgi:hypothetical protein
VGRRVQADAAWPIAWLRRLRPALVAGTVAFVVVAPWLWRNWVAYGKPTVFVSTNRNVVMYKNMQHPLDPAMPTLAALNRRLGYPVVDYEWLWKLTLTVPSNEAEQLAGRILAEEIAAHPWRHLGQIVATVRGFLGFKPFYPNERTGTLFLFRTLVADVPRMNALALDSPSVAHTPDWSYVPRAGDTVVTKLFARVGSAYLLPGRAVGAVVLLAMIVVYLARHARRGSRRDPRFVTVAVLLVGYVATIGMHAVMLSDYDRYATMFDFLAVLIAALIADDALSARRTTRSALRPRAFPV